MRKISEIFIQKAGKEPVFSFEFFPPKNEEGEKRLYHTIDDLKKLNPEYVSVTYGAGGSTREKTLEWVTEIQNHHDMTTMAHFTCVGASKSEVSESLQRFYDAGIRNIMALRGDPPRGETEFKPVADGFPYASDLIEFIKGHRLDFSIGAAAYPEVHMEAESPEKDLEYLKKKEDSGADFFITQLFFDNSLYFEFLEKTKKIGIQKPIIPGIMPITNLKQIDKFTQMAGTKIPDSLVKSLHSHEDDPAKVLELSMDYTVQQIEELLAHGAPGIHFYTLNQSRAAMEILERLQVSGT